VTDAVQRLSAALADRYVIERELGAGGMATVYLAHDVRHDRKVALKVLRPELSAILGAERFLHEIKTTANLQHPHILSLFDSGEADGLVYYVMPYVEGESLRDRLAREKQLPVEDAVRIAREVADALHYAHEHGIVHRDIKPENILLHGGHAMVADFGIALAASRSEGSTRMTETGMSLGTPYYMSPEQSMGEREITPKADIYALGCVLYEMLTAEPPFTGATAQAIIARVMTEEPRSLTLQRKSIPPHIEAAVERALEKLPADRWASAAEFGAALADAGARGHGGTGARKQRAVVPSGRLAVLPWAIAALALAAAAWSLLRPAPAPSPVGRFNVPLTGVAPLANISPVLSPDGSRILFVAQDSQRIPRVFLRHLDREQPVPVAGTDGTLNSASFSPDGQWIMFRQNGKLRRTAVVGGASQLICDVPGSFFGASWGSRDEIVFSTNDTLYRVAAGGGQPSVVLGPDTASGVVRYQNMHFLPDGRTVVAAQITRTGAALVAIDLDKRYVHPLNLNGLTPYYVNGGWLVFADISGTLLVAPFDARRARVTGAAEPLAENVSVTAATFARFSASRSGAIAYFSGGGADRRELVLVSRDGRLQPLAAQPAGYRFPRFSPDGRRLAVGMDAAGRALVGDIWTFDLGSRRLTRLTSDTAGAFPEWTPDGRAVIYAHLAGSFVDLYRVAADGSTDAAPFFSRRPLRVFESRLTPDGRRLVFREDVGGGNRDILVAPIDSPAAARPLAATGFNERGIAVTPDGRWLAFVSNLSGANEVYLRRLEDGSPRWKVSTSGGTEPRWGPGGRELFFRSGDSVYSVPVGLGAEPRLGEPRALFGGDFMSSNNEPLYDVSPDGRQFVMVRTPGGAQPGSTLHLILHHFDQPRGRGRR
jgi:serine/threonine-protein kinase